MRITDLQNYLSATLERFGNLEVLLDFDPEDEDLYEIDSVFCDINPDDETDVSLVLACFETRNTLRVVK